MNVDSVPIENPRGIETSTLDSETSRNGSTDSPEGAEPARKILREIWEREPSPAFSLRLWSGEEWRPQPPKSARFCLNLRSPSAVRLMFSNVGALSFGQAFAYGLADVEGPMEEVFEPLERLMTLKLSWSERLRMAATIREIPRADLNRRGTFAGFDGNGAGPSRERHRDAINYHYDHPVEFWRAWLDETLTYSCAYFDSPDMSLSAAQEAKLDYICRKLRLRPGMTVLDLGCGWGAWILHAARYYGVNAVGITLSPLQAAEARQRIRALGLQSRCQVEIGNFLDYTTEPVDRIASIGSIEHVPAENFDEYFRKAYRLLRPGGQMLNHGITRSPTTADRPGDSFMDKYVFPDHFLATIGRTVTSAESAGFEVRDVESLREHYARTLMHWQTRLEAAEPEVLRFSDPLTFRIFRLYLSGSAHEFRVGRLGLHQTLLVKADNGRSGLPWRRSDWYVQQSSNTR